MILQEHEAPDVDDSEDDLALDLNRTDWNGLTVSGPWTLNVMDFELDDVGSLTSWSISPTVQ